MSDKVTYDTIIALAQSVCDTLQHNDVHWRWFSEEMRKHSTSQLVTEADLVDAVEETHDVYEDDIRDMQATIRALERQVYNLSSAIDDLDKGKADPSRRI